MLKLRRPWRKAPETPGTALLDIDPHVRPRVLVSDAVPRWRARVLDPEAEGVTLSIAKDTTSLDSLL